MYVHVHMQIYVYDRFVFNVHLRSRHLVELAWISESQEPLEPGGVLPSVSPDELVQSLMGEGCEGDGPTAAEDGFTVSQNGGKM